MKIQGNKGQDVKTLTPNESDRIGFLVKLDPITTKKAMRIIEQQEFSPVGVVLAAPSGELCVISSAAVRWLKKDEAWALMHPSTEAMKQEIESLKTPKNGWTKETLAKLGVPWPPPKGWKKRLTAQALTK